MHEKNIIDLATNNNGYILYSMLVENKIPTIYLSRMVEKEILEKVSVGIYITKDTIRDDFYINSLKYSRMVYSRKTALYLNNLTNRQFVEYQANFPYNYNVSNVKGIKCHLVRNMKYELGVTLVETPFGNKVKCYDRERCICDLFIYNDFTEEEIAYAINEYVNVYLNYEKIYKYAKILGIYEKIKNVIGVLTWI